MSQISGGLTLLDLAKKRNSAGNPYEDIIDETVKEIPEVSGFHFDAVTGERRQLPGVGSAAPIDGMNYDSLVRTELPNVDFRDINQGGGLTKSKYESRSFGCKLINPKWGADAALQGARLQEEMADQAEAHTLGALQTIGRQFYYGGNAGNGGKAKGHIGLVNVVDGSMEVDATGTANKSSIWFVKWGRQYCQWMFGENGNGMMPEPARKGDWEDSEGNPLTAWIQEAYFRPGLRVRHKMCVGRIKNIGTAAGKKATWVMMRSAFRTFNDGFKPDAIFMTDRTLGQLHDLLVTPENPNPPLPTVYNGVPIATTSSLNDDEQNED